MKSGPLSLRNGEFDLREAARAAARRVGMTLSEWLDDAIAERAARLRIRPEDLDESGQIDAIAVRLGALPLDDMSSLRPPPRPDAEAPPRGRQPNMRLLDAAAARLGLTPDAPVERKEDAPQVAQRIAELERALGRRAGARATELNRPVESRLRAIAESLLDEEQDDHAQDMRGVNAHLDRLIGRVDHAPRERLSPVRDEIGALRSQVQDLSRAVVVISERAAKKPLEPALLDLLSRIEASRRDGVTDEALAPVTQALIEIRSALEHSPAATARAMRNEIDGLHRRLDTLDRSQDAYALGALRHQVETLTRNLADLIGRLGGHEALEGQIALLSQRIEDIAAAPRQLSDYLTGLVDELRTYICQLDASPAFRALERQVEDIAIHQGRDTSAVAEGIAALRQSIDNLSEHPTMRAMRMQLQHLTQITVDLPPRLNAMLNELRMTIEAMAANPALSPDMRSAGLPGHVAESLAEMRLSLARLATNAGVRLADDQAQRLQDIEQHVVAIAEKLDSPPIIERIASLQEALLARMDGLRSDLPNAQIAALQTRVEDVHRAVANPQEKADTLPADRLEDLFAQLASKLERANESAQDPRALQALENQVLRIAERLDRQGEASDAIGSVERSINELFCRIGDPRETTGPVIGETIVRDLSSLRNLQDETDRHTRATLEAVHETLEKVVDRLAMIEAEVGVMRVHPAAAKPATPAIALPPMDSAALVAPSRQDMSLELAEPRGAQQSFIAAARRATQLMGAAPPPPPRVELNSEAGAQARASQEKTGIGETSRKVMLGVAGLVMSLGAYHVARDNSTGFNGPTQQATKDAPAPAAARPVALAAFDQTPTASIQRPTSPLDVLRDLAESGHGPAQHELASRLIEGRDITRDPDEALRWLSKAAAQNYAPSQYRLAAIYEKGVGVERSLKDALRWYTRAAQNGHVRAMHNLGVLLADGVDDRPDYAAAAGMFRRAAEHGLRDSQYNIAALAARGYGTPLNLVEAYKFFTLAGADGDADALSRRDEVAARMLQKEVDEARRAVATFALREPDVNANEPAAFDAIISTKRAGAPAPEPMAPGRKIDARVTSLK